MHFPVKLTRGTAEPRPREASVRSRRYPIVAKRLFGRLARREGAESRAPGVARILGLSWKRIEGRHRSPGGRIDLSALTRLELIVRSCTRFSTLLALPMSLASTLAFAEAAPEQVAAQLRREIDATLGLEGMLEVVREREPLDQDEPAVRLDRRPRVTFAEVGGLDEVKKAIRRTIILPFREPELYERYGRRAGGGALLFGPPGCGKTLLARATAGECSLPFSNVRIEENGEKMQTERGRCSCY